MTKLEIIDIKNQEVIPLYYKAVELKHYMPEIKVLEETFSEDGQRKALVVEYKSEGTRHTQTVDMRGTILEKIEFFVDTDNYDIISCSEEGIITVESVVSIPVSNRGTGVGVVKIVGVLKYLPEKEAFELDADSVHLESGQ